MILFVGSDFFLKESFFEIVFILYFVGNQLI
jgi:hypothetical protein